MGYKILNLSTNDVNIVHGPFLMSILLSHSCWALICKKIPDLPTKITRIIQILNKENEDPTSSIKAFL